MTPTNRPANRLANESSPYLLQHQHNPVDWYPWGEEAFERARSEIKPLLISIGYSACHWCHVMEQESFSNPDIARLINETVIPVKVDREERPDVDTIYMNACQAMTGHGGWPLNAFVTPDLKPFFLGTYFPPIDYQGRPGFQTVLNRIREAWLLDGSALVQQANALHAQLNPPTDEVARTALSPSVLETFVYDCHSSFDGRHGGFGTAPKFPPDTRLALLQAARFVSADPLALKMIDDTLDAMAYGGLYDHIAGGFARYSVDARWMIPHFEKMLYNQALLIPVYVDSYRTTENVFHLNVARETTEWVLRDLTGKNGMFQSAYDADSEHEEGKFTVWTPKEIAGILPPEDADLFCRYYGITAQGNFEHNTTNPYVAVPPDEFARQNHLDPAEWATRLRELKLQVRKAREERVWPGLDDKCLTGWNGLMISALCKLAQADAGHGEHYALAAARCAREILDKQWDGEVLLRVYKEGRSSIRGTLEDYAFLANALIDLYETDFENHWLIAAREVAAAMIKWFEDTDGGGFFYTDGSDRNLISRTKDNFDGALPASTSMAVQTLLRLSQMDYDDGLKAKSLRAIEAEGRRVNSHPAAFAALLLAGLYARDDTQQIIISGPAGDERTQFIRAIHSTYHPHRVIAVHPAEQANMTGTPKMVEGKHSTDSVKVYICKNYTCQAPLDNLVDLQQQLLTP